MGVGKMKYLPEPFITEFERLKKLKGITKDKVAFEEAAKGIKIGLELDRIMNFGVVPKRRNGK